MAALWHSRIASSEITPKHLFVRRREFLKIPFALTVCSVANVTAARASQRRARLAIANRMVTTDERVTPYDAVTGYNNFYEFGTDKSDPARHASAFKATPWSVVVDGECGKPGTITLEDVLKPHPLEERIYRMRCVEGWSMVIPWVGFALSDLLKRFEPTGDARFVEFTTVVRPSEMVGQRRRFPPILPWPYTEGLRMDEAMHPLSLMAVGVYGEALPNQNGAQLRLVVPWKYGFKSIKSIVRIRFVRRQPRTTWMNEWPDAYGFYSNVNPDVDHPDHSQATERRIGEVLRRKTLMFNGYAEQVASLYSGMNLRRDF